MEETNEEWERPTTSTRDPAELRSRLEAWLAGVLPDGAGPEVSGIEVPGSTGMSSETLLFEAAWQEGGAPKKEALVARIAPDPAAVPVFPVYDMGRQFDTIRLVGELSDVPVPRVRWCEPDGAGLGAPFFVMDRVEGEVPPDVMPYNFGDSWLFHATAEQQRRLQDTSVGVLARLHAIEDAERAFAFLTPDHPGDTAMRRALAEQWAYYQWVAEGAPSPLIERAFAWLDDHWPADEGPTVLSWGDSRIGNVMYRNFEPVAVFDWEMACLAPPEVDVAWMIFLHRFFEDIAGEAGLPGMPQFMRRDDVAATYERLSGYPPRDLDFYSVYAGLRHAIVMSRVRRRSIHFGEAEMPDDIDDLIMHRQALEAMLAGTYWSSI
jgi:aminoglycoside phosphotransferase (APT) family kinase protein